MADEKNAEDLGDQLYDKYAKPLERDHWGALVAIARDGRLLLGDDLNDVARRGPLVLGRGCFIFKVGEKAVGHMRTPRRMP
jgi:hypothetical protein